jgi:hypothetical protein
MPSESKGPACDTPGRKAQKVAFVIFGGLAVLVTVVTVDP